MHQCLEIPKQRVGWASVPGGKRSPDETLAVGHSPPGEPLVRSGPVRARWGGNLFRHDRPRSVPTTRRCRLGLAGGPDAATAVLSTVAASMVSLTALVLTITMVVVQLAMGQFSPRIVQRILRDKPSQLAIGLFVATFVHAVLALREVQTTATALAMSPALRF